MPEEVLYITFIAMVAVIMTNIICAVDHIKAKNMLDKRIKECIDYFFSSAKERWASLGAYETEDGKMYLDLEGGIRLVIFEGKIEGWYIP